MGGQESTEVLPIGNSTDKEGVDCREWCRTPAGKFCIIVSFAVFVVLLSLFLSSYRTLGKYRWGLRRNTVTGTVDLTHVFEPGVHCIGFWNEFVTFPSTVQTIEYTTEGVEAGVLFTDPLHLRSKDKVPMFVEVSVQYQRKKEELVVLFQKAMTASLQENLFASGVRAELTKIMSKRNAADCWRNRAELTQDFLVACQRVLDELHASCWGLQFYRSHLADEFESELVQTEVQKQRKRIEIAKQDRTRVEAETKVILATYAKHIIEVESRGAAERYNIEVQASTSAEAERLTAEASAIAHVRDKLGSMTDAQVIRYQQLLTLGADLQDVPLFYNFDNTPPDYVVVPGGRRLESAENRTEAEEL